MRALSDDEIRKLKTIINEGVQVTEEVTTLKEGLRDTVKAVAEELDIKPAVINKAISTAYKADLHQKREAFDELEEVLQTVGRDY